MMLAGFRNELQPGARQQRTRTPHSHDCGDVSVPWNIGRAVYRFRAPAATVIHDPTLFVGAIESPGGAPVVVEAWKNGQYGGDVTLEHGPNRFQDGMPLAAMDVIELRVCAKGTGEHAVWLRDLWVMFTT